MSRHVILRDYGPNDVLVRVDRTHECLLTMGELDHLIQEGFVYDLTVYGSAVANGGSLTLLIQTPSDYNVHIGWHAAAGANAQLSYYENTDVSTVGTTVVPLNRNRTSSNVANVVFTQSPTVSISPTADTIQFLIPGGTKSGATGGNAADAQEWILDTNVNGYVVFKNISGAATPMELGLMFYEVPTTTGILS